MHQVFDAQNFILSIKACVYYFYFCHQNNVLSKILFIVPKKTIFVLKIFKLCTSRFLSFFLSWPFLADFIGEND